MSHKGYLGKRVLIPVKGFYLCNKDANMSGFKNAVVTGILSEITPAGDLVLCGEDGSLMTTVPASSIGAVLSEGSSFYSGTGDSDDASIMYDEETGDLN